MTKNSLKTFYIIADLTICTSISIQANSLEDAVEKSKKLEIDDFVKCHGDINEVEIKITGAFE